MLMLHEYMRAALAQSVERRLGKAEVGGSIPLGSLKTLDDSRVFLYLQERKTCMESGGYL